MAERICFGKLSDVIELPDLIEIQSNSYRDFPSDACAAE